MAEITRCSTRRADLFRAILPENWIYPPPTFPFISRPFSTAGSRMWSVKVDSCATRPISGSCSMLLAISRRNAAAVIQMLASNLEMPAPRDESCPIERIERGKFFKRIFNCSTSIELMGQSERIRAKNARDRNIKYLTAAAVFAGLWRLAYSSVFPASHWLLFGLIGLTPDWHFCTALEFFICDAVKIPLLLTALIYVIAWIRASMKYAERVQDCLAGKRRGLGYLLGALFGAVTPFCFCSSIPLFFLASLRPVFLSASTCRFS